MKFLAAFHGKSDIVCVYVGGGGGGRHLHIAINVISNLSMKISGCSLTGAFPCSSL